MSHMDTIETIRSKVEKKDEALLNLLCERGELLAEAKQLGIRIDDTLGKQRLLNQVDSKNKGPYKTETIKEIFKKIFDGTDLEDHQNVSKETIFLHSRKHRKGDSVVHIKGENVGNGEPHFIIGPCSVESYEQVSEVAAEMAKRGLRLLRGGAFKPRTSPYDFQGLGLEGLEILAKVAKEYDMAVITEIMSTNQIDKALALVDVIQIGSRNMHNFDLLKAVGKTNKPILLKRGLSATIEEFKLAAEYILAEGNKNVILCERGIRTYETATRNTLDISSVPILKQETHLPVIVDVTHSTGRKDILIPAAKAALAVGADGIMAEVHPNPKIALSDAKQQMDIHEFHQFIDNMKRFLNEKVLDIVFN